MGCPKCLTQTKCQLTYEPTSEILVLIACVQKKTPAEVPSGARVVNFGLLLGQPAKGIHSLVQVLAGGIIYTFIRAEPV